MRYVYIFCGAFLLFFLIGAYTERQARKKLVDREFLLEAAASKFDYLPSEDLPKIKDARGKLYYRCGSEILYSLNTTTGVLQAEKFRSLRPPSVEPSMSHEEIALLAAGWGISEGAAYLRVSLGMSWRDKIAALLGGITGYTLGRLAFSRTRPACDGDETARLLNQVSSKELSRVIIRLNLRRYLILLDKSTVAELPSQITSLKQAYEIRVGHPMRSSDPECMPQPLRSPGIVCRDFLAIEGLEAKVADSDSTYTAKDFDDSFYCPWAIAAWFWRYPEQAQKGFDAHAFRGITTKPDLIRTGDKEIIQQGKELQHETVSTLTAVLRYGLYTVGFVLACVILFVGITAWSVLFRAVVLRLRRDLGSANAIMSRSEQKPPPGP